MIILSLGLLGLIIYFGVSPKSSRRLKLTALIALGLIGLSAGICGFFIIRGPGKEPELLDLPIFQEAAPKAKSSNAGAIIAFMAVFLFIMGLIFFLAFRDQKKKAGSPKTANKSQVLEKSDALDLGGAAGTMDEDSFDIDLE